MIKDIVVNLALRSRDPAGAFAVSIADTFGAHLAAIAFSYDPIIPATVMGTIPVSMIDGQRAENDKAAAEAVKAFNETAQRTGISAEARVISASLAGGADQFGRIARRFDLAVTGQAEPDSAGPEDMIIEGALFGSGRPVVVVPYIQKSGLKLDRIMVCWDGSRNAARAVADAMPLLARAKQVDVVIIASEPAKSDEIPGADIAQHLARHGLTVDLKRIVATETDVPSTILSYVADSDIDFIVMGGYGHSRLREFVLGGATRGILGAMTVPVLMSH